MWIGSDDCGGTASYRELMQEPKQMMIQQEGRHRFMPVIIAPYCPGKRRQRDVPRYIRCPFVRITRDIYDHGYDEPKSVECGHPGFSQYEECSGQCAVFEMPYGERGGRE